MRKIIIKANIAIILAIFLAKSGEVGFGIGVIFGVFLYILLSWFGMIYHALHGFGIVIKCIISFFGSVLSIVVPTYILEALLPDNWFRTVLTTIVTIIMLIIPFVRDWKEYKSEI